MFYMSNVFNSPQDAQDLNFAFPRLADIDVLRALGVRFAITDLKLPAHRASARRTVPLKDGSSFISTSFRIRMSPAFRR